MWAGRARRKMSGVRWFISVLAAACVCAALVLPISASAVVQGYGASTYTKTSGNDAFWWHWSATTGGDSNGNVNYTRYLCFRTYANGVLVEDSNGTSGSGDAELHRQPAVNSLSQADYAATPFQTSTVLQDGTRYDMCAASGFYLQPFIWKWTVRRRLWTIVDRNRPQIAVAVDGTAQYTRNPVLQLRIDYADATSPPGGRRRGRVELTCSNRGAPCSPGGAPNALAAARPPDPASRTTFFTCSADVSAQPDGLYGCAFAADGAVLDNPTGSNQFAQAIAEQRESFDYRLRPRRARPRRR